MQLTLNRIPLSAFTQSPGERKLVAEESDLRCYGGCFQRLYDDACDVGFTTVHLNGHEVRWYLVREFPHHDELGGWEFKACTETIRKWPDLAKWTIIVFND